MRLFSTCDSCHKVKLYTNKRYFKVAQANDMKVTSKSHLCGGCAKKIKMALK